MAARTVTENVLRAFSANAGFLVLGAEAADYSAVDAAPTLTDMTEDGHAGKSLKPTASMQSPRSVSTSVTCKPFGPTVSVIMRP